MPSNTFISSTLKASEDHSGASFVFFRVNDFNLENLSTWLHRNRKSFRAAIKEDSAERDEAFAVYESYFKERQAWFPLRTQLDNARRGGLTKKFPVLELMLGLELSSGLLIGAHDLRQVVGRLQLDSANAGEKFESLAKRKIIECQANDLVIRDKQAVIASITRGPDFRTAVQPLTQGETQYSEIIWSVMGVPGIEFGRLNAVSERLSEALYQTANEVERKDITL